MTTNDLSVKPASDVRPASDPKTVAEAKAAAGAKRAAASTNESGMATVESHQLAKDLSIDHVPGRSALDSVSDDNAPPVPQNDARRKARAEQSKDDGVGVEHAKERRESERGADRALAEKGAGRTDGPDLSANAQARSARDAAFSAPVSTIGTVLMVRDEPQVPGGPTSANVHQEQIADFKAHGWRTV